MWKQSLRTWRKLAWYLLCACVGLLPLYAPVKLAQAQATPQAPPFDYTVDRDGDGLPDQLVAAMKHLHELRKQGAGKDAIEAARTDLFAHFPYAGPTRATQAKIEMLARSLGTAKDDIARAAIMQQINTLVESLAQDPQYAKTLETFERLMPDRVVVPLPDTNQTEAAAMSLTDSAATFVYPVDRATPDGQMLTTSTGNESVSPPASETNILSNPLYLPLIRTTGREESEASNASSVTSARVEQPHVVLNYHAYMPSIQQPKLIDFTNLQRGHLLFRDAKGPGSISNSFPLVNYAKYYSHVGMYNGSDQRVYEANLSDGVNLRSITTWQQFYPVAFMYSTYSPVTGLDWAEGHYGTASQTHYFDMLLFVSLNSQSNNYNSNKSYEGQGLYCSQLTWKIFQYRGMEVDSDSPDYHDYLVAKWGQTLGDHFTQDHVMPDEIYLSPNLNVYDKGLGAFTPTP